MAEKKQASGSLWNPNSWHWEQKNKTEISKKMLTERILKMELNEGTMKIRHTEVKSITGDAEINVRKGK